MSMPVGNELDRGASGIDPSSSVETAQKSTTHDERETLAIAANNTTAPASNNEPPPPPKPKYIPKPPKRTKRKLSKKARGDGHLKRSSYDHEGAKEVLGLDPSAKDQQIISAITIGTASAKPPPPPPSPDKKAVKRRVKKLKHDNELLKKGSAKDKKKIAEQDVAIRGLLQQLRMEKKASNTIMDTTMPKAMESMDQALQLREDAKAFELEVEVKLIAEVEQYQEDLREERQHHARETARMKSKVENKLQKQQHDHDASKNVRRAKYENQKVS